MQINLNISEDEWGIFCEYCVPLKIKPEDIVSLYVRNLSTKHHTQELENDESEKIGLDEIEIKPEDDHDKFWRRCLRYKIRQHDVANILNVSQGAISRWQNKIGSSGELVNMISATHKNLDHFFSYCFHAKYKNVLDDKIDNTTTKFFTEQFNFLSKFNQEEMYYIVWDCFGYLISINKIRNVETHFENIANHPEVFEHLKNETNIEELIHNCIKGIIACMNKNPKFPKF